MPGMHDTIVAFDFGLRRIGVAVGQQVTGSANPLGVIRNSEAGPVWRAIDALLNEWQPDRLIVGMPSHTDGSRSEIANHVDEFLGELGRFERPIDTVDERFTSIEAEAQLKDARAAGARGHITQE